ncbi:helix-turn-helix domain-containing protein [Sphingobacterium bambusae]|uniref:Helix-turn-helix domain-containing protein n=1 Tax=Sphingobacterium bambusae TaxID=662858 RepID=A0ABW6BGU7_9SPHI|nr:helix-turn-helix transcriptional regulator [Sphingobacterium bambusae]WPL49447.1 helix-turn-helix transcriptional regulator [Sphingobacterium bambusae]
MENNKPYRIKTISEVYRLSGNEKPHHPLIGIIDLSQSRNDAEVSAVIFDFYVITMKSGCDKLYYGQQKYDFDEGVMALMAPGQILRGTSDANSQMKGWMLFIHPDFLWNTSLAKKIKQYEYFGYNTSEALFLSDKEQALINTLIDNIKNEYSSNIDKFSQEVIIAQLELLFTYAKRFYERQFITRKVTNSKVLNRVEEVLNNYFNGEEIVSKGLPSVQYVAEELNISIKYLSSLLKQLTGSSTQQHIHEKLIEKAKEKLSTTDLSVSEIAYELGFEHSQSFSKLFKTKTKQSPLEFRAGFN